MGKKSQRGMLPQVTRAPRGGASSVSSEATLDGVLSSLPTTPEVQLDCGLEILRRAFTQRVKELEDENKEVRELGKDKMSQAQVLEQKVAQLEKSIEEMTHQTLELANTHQTLTSERDALTGQYKKISHNVKALMAFKKNCSSFLDHKDDFDVETIHDSLPPHLRDMVLGDTPRDQYEEGPGEPRARRLAAPVHAAHLSTHLASGQAG